MQRVLRSTQADLRFLVTGKDGAAVDATGTPTVAITRDSDGTAVSAGNATNPAGTGVYGYTLTPAHTAEVNLLRATLTATVETEANQLFRSVVEIVGGHMCSLEAIQTAQGSSPTSDVVKLREAREWAEGWLEHECRVAFRPRYRKETVRADGRTALFLRQPFLLTLLAASVDGEALTAGDLADVDIDSAGVLHRDGAWDGKVVVSYTHGYEQTPEPGVRAAVKLARFYLTQEPSNRDERATRIETEEASYSLVTPGMRDAIFSIPEVNVFVERFGFTTVAS